MANTANSSVSDLTATAMTCPMMGPKLASISAARTYASVAGAKEVQKLHQVSFFSSTRAAGARMSP